MKTPSSIKTTIEKPFPFKDEELQSINGASGFCVVYVNEDNQPGGSEYRSLETVTASCWIESRDSREEKHLLELKFQAKDGDYGLIEDSSTCSGELDDFNQIKQQMIGLMKETLPPYITRLLPSD